MVVGVFDLKNRDEGNGSCIKMQVKWIMIITMRWPAAMRGTSSDGSRNKTEIFWTLLVDNGHQHFPNQFEFGLESASCKIILFSKLNWNWFGKSYAFFGCSFSEPNWIWFGKGWWIKCSLTTHFHLTCYNDDTKRLWTLIFLWRSEKRKNLQSQWFFRIHIKIWCKQPNFFRSSSNCILYSDDFGDITGGDV